jgi:Cu-processing system permease protein
MSLTSILIIARKEIRDALRNRWFIAYTIAFAALALALSYLSLAGTGIAGLAGFGRTTAGLVNLVLLFVPIIALSISATTLAGERERGTLAFLLAQPVTRLEVLMGKYIGLSVSLSAAIALGFGLAGLLIAYRGGGQGVDDYLLLVLMSIVLGLGMISVGMLISSIARRAALAIGLAIAVWFCLTLLSDLGLMGSAVAFRLRIDELFHLSLINPLQVFKMAVLRSVNASLDVLGPAGVYATQAYGRWLPLLFGGALVAWIVTPLLAAAAVFARRTVE